ADGILDYLEFAKGYIASCEERYGVGQVERLLDAAHALMGQGIHRYPRAKRWDLSQEEKRERERQEHAEAFYNDLWRTLPRGAPGRSSPDDERRRALLELPQENLLYFLEK